MGKRIDLPFTFKPNRLGADPPEKSLARAKVAIARAIRASKDVEKATAKSNADFEAVVNGKFDKVTYQREYMRRYRAKKAGK